MMDTFAIGRIPIRLQTRYSYVLEMCEPYLTSEKPWFTVSASEQELLDEQADTDFSLDYCESICLYRKIALKLIEYDAFVLHAAVIRIGDKGFAFTGKSGAGKSTHTKLWKDYFGEKATIINGDKPVIRKIKNQFVAFGTPWCGKEGWQTNDSVPLSSLSFIEQGKANKIHRLNTSEIVGKLFHQVLFPEKKEETLRFMELLNLFVEDIPIYELTCTISNEAVRTAYKQMREG